MLHLSCIQIDCTGDVPTARSGHAIVTFENILFLFGGLDYSEEAVYNDLYMLNLGLIFLKNIL